MTIRPRGRPSTFVAPSRSRFNRDRWQLGSRGPLVSEEFRVENDTRVELHAAAGQLVAWCLLALINQILVLVLAPAAPPLVRVLHHAYDFGQLVALGVLSFACVKLAERATARLAPSVASWLRIGLLAAAVFGVSILIVGEDLENFARRHHQSPLLVRLAASCLFSVVLSSTRLLCRFRRTWQRASLLALGSAIAVTNAVVLRGDYRSAHVILAWLAALVLEAALEGLTLPRLGQRAARVILIVLAPIGLAALLVPPRNAVLARLYSVSSSVAAPYVARFMPERGGLALERVPARFRSSPWFRDRKGLPAVPPTRAVRTPEPTIVILLTIDAVRADVLENRDYEKLLPELTELKKTSVYFKKVHAPASATSTTFASLFTGKYYGQLHWETTGNGRNPLLDDTARFPELLTKAGVHTVHVNQLGRIRAVLGIGRGFTVEHYLGNKPKAAEGIDKLIGELEAQHGPAFLFAHFLESHAPYDLGGKKGSAFQRYVREIGVVDKQIGRLRQYLDDKGLAKNTVLIFSSDHGEAFGEHASQFHATTGYEEQLRVPMLIHAPLLPPRVIDEPVAFIDIGPTVLDLFGLPTPGDFMAQSLLPLVAGKATELTRPIAFDIGRGIQGLYFEDGKKVILNRKGHTVEVYDLESDPNELHNLAELAESEDESIQAAIETTRLFFEVHRLKTPGPSAAASTVAPSAPCDDDCDD